MYYLTVDIGGTFIKYAVINEKLEIAFKSQVETPLESYEEELDIIADIYQKAELSFKIEGIAVSVPGIVDASKGYISMGGAIKYNYGQYLARDIVRKCDTKVVIENDAKCAAMAEAKFGALKDVEDGFVLIFGTMIGGAFIKAHELYKGKHFSAGEVSYIITDRASDASSSSVWGKRCGVGALCEYYAKEKAVSSEGLDGKAVFDALDRGDRAAEIALKKFAREIAVQIFNLQTVLDPELFAIGGGIAQRKELISYIKSELDNLYDNCIYNVPRAEICPCRYITDANLIGALSVFMNCFE